MEESSLKIIVRGSYNLPGKYSIENISGKLREKGYSGLTTPVEGMTPDIIMDFSFKSSQKVQLRFGEPPYIPIKRAYQFLDNYEQDKPQSREALYNCLA